MKRTAATLTYCIGASVVTALATGTPVQAQQRTSTLPIQNSAFSAPTQNAGPDASFHNDTFSGLPTRLVIGHSASISTAHRMTRVYVTNPSVLNAYTATPNEVLVTAKDAGVSSLMVWDETGSARTYLFSSDLDIDGLRSAIKTALPHDNVLVAVEQSHILLSGSVTDKDRYQLAEHLASQYSKDVSNALVINSSSVKQVRLKVRIVEIDRTKLEQVGFNLFSAGGNTLERGTAEYNLALGEKRAQAARDHLIFLGVLPGQLDVISYGKEKELCVAENEACFQKNRRASLEPRR